MTRVICSPWEKTLFYLGAPGSFDLDFTQLLVIISPTNIVAEI